MLLVVSVVISCKSDTTTKRPDIQLQAIPDSVTILAAKLTELFQSPASVEDSILCYFPHNFNLFLKLYGSDYNGQTGVLSDQYVNHLEFVEKSTNISPLFKGKILIRACVDGYWQADAVSMLQHITKAYILEYPEIAKKQLDQYTEYKKISFWKFIFDGPHPDDPEVVKYYKEVIEVFRILDANSVLFIERGYNLAIEDNKH